MAFDAIVLAGGAARRLGGADKPGLELGGVPLIEHVLAACAGAGVVVVVGPRRELSRPVAWAREEPSGGGPVAAIAAGLPSTVAPLVLVLAADLPGIGPAVPVLLAAVGDADAAALVDAGGRRNRLAAVWRRSSLVPAIGRLGDPAGAAMRELYAGMECVDVADRHGWGRDCDSWAELAALRRTVGGAAPAPPEPPALSTQFDVPTTKT